MPQAIFQPPVLFQPSVHSGSWAGTSVLGNTPVDSAGQPPKKPKKKPKKKQPLWLVPVLAGSGVLLFGGVVLFTLARRRKRAEVSAPLGVPLGPNGVTR